MKQPAITVKQPLASLIVDGVKDIENRTWPCPKKYIGQRVLIHASMKPDNIKFEIEGQASVKEIKMFSAFGRAEEENLFGCIIGSVEIVDCVINHPSIWAEKVYASFDDALACKRTYNWVLANPIKFPEPIPCKGKLSFWDYPNILAEPEEKGGELFCHCQLPVSLEAQVRPLGGGQFECRYCGGKWYR